jgi:hypothetical protein
VMTRRTPAKIATRSRNVREFMIVRPAVLPSEF